MFDANKIVCEKVVGSLYDRGTLLNRLPGDGEGIVGVLTDDDVHFDCANHSNRTCWDQRDRL